MHVNNEKLQRILNHQFDLMSRFRSIEKANGFHFPDVPVDLESFEGQHEVRRLAWCIQEELCEAAEQFQGSSTPELKKELIDALHFIAELMITIGYTPDDILPEDPANPDYPFVGIPPNLFNTMVELGLLINQLKSKPWKQTKKPFDRDCFKERFGIFIRSFLTTCKRSGLDWDSLTETYFGKALENQQRIDSGV